VANEAHLAVLRHGVARWNAWRSENPRLRRPNLADADLARADLSGADLHGADLSGTRLRRAVLQESTLVAAILTDADLTGANLIEASLVSAEMTRATLYAADLSRAVLDGAILREATLSNAALRWTDLTDANLIGANLVRANLTGASLARANLSGANLTEADLTGANLSGADLQRALLVATKLARTDLSGCRVYGIAAWDVTVDEETRQANLVITRAGEPTITVDELEVAQFVYLLLNNRNVRRVIDTVTSKTVLILGRFTPERKAVLDGLRAALRQRNYLPILFDFEVPSSRDLTETVSLLARMARFVVADLTDARSLPQELAVIVPHLPSVPIQPLLQTDDRAYAMFEHWQRFPWVLPICRYHAIEDLLASLADKLIIPAERKVLELRPDVTLP
jgi:uncharacterized protein YjbI with pentapeptide repeats